MGAEVHGLSAEIVNVNYFLDNMVSRFLCSSVMSSYTRNWKKICGKDASGTGMSKKRDVRKQERRIGLKGAPVRCFRTDSGSGETRDTSGTSGAAGTGSCHIRQNRICEFCRDGG